MTRILADVGNERQIIEEERQNWLRRVLIALGADENVISENTLEAKRHVSQLNLDVESHYDGSIDILRLELSFVKALEDNKEVPVETGRQLVAQWLPPSLIRIKEAPKDYYIITLREWALPFQME
jgi:hypothetical protein